MYKEVLQNLTADTLLVTVNQRLAAQLHIEYGALQQEQQWPTPPIIPLTTWLKQLWQNSEHGLHWLEGPQTHWLWENLIRHSTKDSLILPTSQVAYLVNEAYTQIKWWNVPWETYQQSIDTDLVQFYNWCQSFEEELTNKSAACWATLPQHILTNSCSDLPKKVTLIGFQDTPPMLDEIFRKWQDNCEITNYTPTKRTQTTWRTETTTTNAEIHAMAAWAHRKLQQSQCPQNVKIGCVIPDLKQLRNNALMAFKQVFRNHETPFTNAAIHPFNISAGRPLLDYPIIRTALAVIELDAKATIDTDLCWMVIGSPYINSYGHGMEYAAELDVALREKQMQRISNQYLLRCIEKLQNLYPESPTSKRLRDFFTAEPAPKQYPSEWAITYNERLQLIGWPGQQNLDSEEYQLVGQWIEVLKKLSTMDDIAGQMTQQQLIQFLRHQLTTTTFQPQTEHSNAPIQVLGTLEATGLPFDHLWVMGLDDVNWPPNPQTNPFIPHDLQVEYKLPHHNAEHELEYTKKLQHDLISGAREVILSSAQQDSNNSKQASALIIQFPLRTLTQIHASTNQSHLEDWIKPNPIEMINDNYAPAVTDDEKLRGGTAIASNQAVCPFRAFAIHRLQAKQRETPMFGVSALAHGILLHNTLEMIWRKLQNQKTLINLDHNDLRDLITTNVDIAIEKSEAIPKRFAHLERTRLIDHLESWLEYEKERPEFSVSSIEKTESLHIANKKLTVRIDRIDELATGGKVIIDYKTSMQANPDNWFGEPPLESQLPLYASYTANVVGCAYALIHQSNCELKGFIDDAHWEQLPVQPISSPPKWVQPKTWEVTLSQWREQLENIFQAFLNGYAAVEPHPASNICNHCELNSFCRIGVN